MREVKRAVASSGRLRRLVAAIADVNPSSVQRWAMSVGVTPRVEKMIEDAIRQSDRVSLELAEGPLGEFARLSHFKFGDPK